MKRYYSLLALLCCCVPSAWAQIERNQNGEISDEEVVIIKEKELKLPEAVRNFEKVTIPLPVPAPTPQKYSFQTFGATLPAIDPRMSVVRLPEDELDKLYGTYLKGGLGNYGTTYLEAFHNSKRTNDYAYGVHFKHFASAKGSVKNSGSGENRFAGYGKYFNEKYILTGRLDYSRERYNYYGYPTEVSKDSLKQIYNTLSFGATLQNATDSAAFNYVGNINFSNFSDSHKNRESEFGIGFNSSYKLNETMTLFVPLEVALLQYKNDTLSLGRNYTALRPSFQYKEGALTASVGFNLGFCNDTAKLATKTTIYPTVELAYQLMGGSLTALAGFNGDLEKRTYRNTVQLNPFVKGELPLSHANKTMDLYAGFKGVIAKDFFYKITGGMQQYKQLAFFVSDTADVAKFTLAYDSAKVNITRFTGEFGYAPSDKWRFAFKTDYYGYSTKKLAKAWHSPALRMNLNTRYNYREKVYIDFDLYYIGTQYAFNPLTNQTQELKGIADVDLRIDYKFSQKFSAFLNMDNILSQKNPRYLYYQTRGLLVMLGATASF
ncbi:hypothetical protein SAMN05421780_10888 [Flexibacter flexilis DSM 6793]|uniref:TonB dependent receptor n=1 Tax=Flexibacter flexilis DSM 6793 TaxID=927664 RepID=A0A1I1L837_9BACT|nr:hypothetical protein [Flexibacter flexilis]SFC68672.1 hypothetical protein SAMN05421780_10888 [Flexibacter flexilis DSM 6793]